MSEVKQRESSVIAVDVGGTQIRAAIVSRRGRIMAKESYPTLAVEGPDSVIGRILLAIDQLLEGKSGASSLPDSIILAVAGAIDYDKGSITVSPNLPGWHNVLLRDMVGKRYGLETFLINDASAAALGEHRFGAGKGVNNLIYLTVSTGIGGGIIINGELYSGASGSAGELGHMTIDVNGPVCSCGNTGCLEVLASGKAMAREAISRLGNGERSALTEMVGAKLDSITTEEISIAAQRGDSLALEVVSQAARYLGVGLANLVNIFNPEMIIVGGGVAKMGDILLNPAREVVGERAFPLLVQAVRIVNARNIDEAGLLGAAAFAFQHRLNQKGAR